MATDDDDAATLRERVRELEQTVAQQQDTIQQLLPSRRAILAGGAGLVGGAALTGQASAQSAAGQVGTSSEPVDVEAATVTADSVNTDSASVTNQLDAGSVNTGNAVITDPVTVYVRSDGNDTNDGLTASDAKATVNAAIDDAPIMPDDKGPVVVDIGSGTFAAPNTADLSGFWRFDGAGKATTTLDAAGQSYGIEGWRAKYEIANLELVNADIYGLRARRKTSILLDNARVADSGTANINIVESSVRSVNGSEITYPSSSQAVNVIVGYGRLSLSNSTVDGATNSVIDMGSGSCRVDIDAQSTIRGDGSGTTSELIKAFSGANLKLGNATLEGANYIVKKGRDSLVNVTSDLTKKSDIAVAEFNLSDAGGEFYDGGKDESYSVLPRNDTPPSPNLIDGGIFPGLHYYDSSVGVPRFRSRQNSGWLAAGCRELADPAAGDILEGERVWDTTNDRLLYKDRSGTVHAINQDTTF